MAKKVSRKGAEPQRKSVMRKAEFLAAWSRHSGGPLLRNSRKTDSVPAAKSAEFLFHLAPPGAGFAL